MNLSIAYLDLKEKEVLTHICESHLSSTELSLTATQVAITFFIIHSLLCLRGTVLLFDNCKKILFLQNES